MAKWLVEIASKSIEDLILGRPRLVQKSRQLFLIILIDVREVTESYSAFDFVSEAKMAIEDIHSRGKIAIIAGGTGLYIQSLLEGYHLGGETPHEEILAYRASLEPYTDEELAHLVAQAGLEIPQFNRRRAMRALEIAHFGQDLENQETLYEPLIICLMMNAVNYMNVSITAWT